MRHIRLRWLRRGLGILIVFVLAISAPEEHALAEQPMPDTIVYITRTGIRYHRDWCRSLRRSRIPIQLDEAIRRGYTPCRICRPPWEQQLDISSMRQRTHQPTYQRHYASSHTLSGFIHTHHGGTICTLASF